MPGPDLAPSKPSILEDSKLIAALQIIQDHAPHGLEGVVKHVVSDLLDRARQCQCEDLSVIQSFRHSPDGVGTLHKVAYLYERVKAYEDATKIFDLAQEKGLIPGRENHRVYHLPFEERNAEAERLATLLNPGQLPVVLSAESFP